MAIFSRVWCVIGLGVSIVAASCEDKSPAPLAPLESRVRDLWRSRSQSAVTAEYARRMVATCDIDALGDTVLCVLTGSSVATDAVGAVRDALAQRDPGRAHEVWGALDRIVWAAEFSVPESRDARVRQLRLRDPALFVRVFREMQRANQLGAEDLRVARAMMTDLGEGLIRVPMEDGGYSRVVGEPCIRRLQLALEVLLEGRGS